MIMPSFQENPLTGDTGSCSIRNGSSVQRASRARQQNLHSSSSSHNTNRAHNDEESSSHHHQTTKPSNKAVMSTSSNQSSESSPSKDKKTPHHIFFPNTCKCCGDLPHSFVCNGGSQRRLSRSSLLPSKRRLFSTFQQQEQPHLYHPTNSKWRQRSLLLLSMCFFTCTMGWRMLLLHGELLAQQETYHDHQERLLAIFVRRRSSSSSKLHQKNWFYQPPKRRRRRNQHLHYHRKRRTQPPPLETSTAKQYLQSPDYQLQVEDDFQYDDTHNIRIPTSFSLNATTSRVVLVGMLRSSWGMSLALHLYQQYGISHMMGVDDLLPNVHAYRMSLLTNRYEYLARHWPNLTLWTPPPASSSIASSTRSLVHVLQEFQPTHVMYLSPTVSLDRILQSYHDDDEAKDPTFAATLGLSWNVTARLFDIRHRTQSLQHLLEALRVVASYNNTNDEPQWSPLSRPQGNNQPVQQRLQQLPRLLVASAAPSCSLLPQHYQLDQVLVNTYMEQYGIVATHILVPPLYGNWLDDHDPLHQHIHDVLEQDITLQPPTINTTNGDETDIRFPPSKDAPRYLDVRRVLQVVTKLLQQPPSSGRRKKMTILPPDTSWTSLLQAIADTIKSSDPAHHSIHALSISSKINSYNATAKSVQLEKRVRDLLAWKYVQDFPWRDPLAYTTINASLWMTKLPIQEQLPAYAQLPCASECSYLTNCVTVSTAFDESVVLACQQATEETKFVVYTVNLDPSLTTLPPIHVSDTNTTPAMDAIIASVTAMTSRVAFISDQSRLAQRHKSDANTSTTTTTDLNQTLNGQVEENGWKLVWLAQDRLSPADRLLAKITPGRLFATSVNKAMYVAPHKIDRAPILPALTYLMDHMVDGKPQRGKTRAVSLTSQGRKNEQSVRWVYQPPTPARRAVLFAQEQVLKLPTTSIQKAARQLWLSNSTKSASPSRRRQMNFYEHVIHLMRSTPRFRHRSSRVFFQWIDTAILVHNIRLSAGRSLRCEWYGEHLSWHDDKEQEQQLTSFDPKQGQEGMEELSLAYVIAKHRMQGRLGKPIMGDESWSPYFDLSKAKQQRRYDQPPPRLVNGVGQEIFLRVLSRPMGENSPSESSDDEDGD